VEEDELSNAELEDRQSSAIEDMELLSDIELSIEELELSMDDIGGQLVDDDIIELSPLAEDDASCAKPGMTAAAKLPASNSAETKASWVFTFFTLWLVELPANFHVGESIPRRPQFHPRQPEAELRATRLKRCTPAGAWVLPLSWDEIEHHGFAELFHRC
jgi:hypothetical protein